MQARLFVSLDWARWLNVVAMRIVWIGIFALALWALFRAGLQHVAINGG